MKPYLLVLHNKVKIWLFRLIRKDITAEGIQLFSRKTSFVVSKGSSIKIGDRFVTDGDVSLHANNKGVIEIGERVYFNRGTMISCKSHISIGSGCRFGPNVIIIDNNHKYNAEHGVLAEHASSPIIIGNNCWIGANTVVLKGTSIGNNCVIGAGCIVAGSVPSSSVVYQKRDLTIKQM